MKTVAYYGYIIERVIEVLLENRIVSSVLLFSNFLDYLTFLIIIMILVENLKNFTNYISTHDLLK